jgi:hypothetical protein
MKSMIRKPKKDDMQQETERKSKRKVDAKKIAQCCAKVSKSVAGCHD